MPAASPWGMPRLSRISHTLPAAAADAPAGTAFLAAVAPRDTRSTRGVVGPSGPSRRQATAWATTCLEHANAHAGPCGRCARSLPAPRSKRRADGRLRALATKVCEKYGLWFCNEGVGARSAANGCGRTSRSLRFLLRIRWSQRADSNR